MEDNERELMAKASEGVADIADVADETVSTPDGKSQRGESQRGESLDGKPKSGKAHKKHMPLKRSTQVAIGASITAVMLALIITIIVIALQTVSGMAQIFATNFSYVDNVVREDKFIAGINGDYYLMEGDRKIKGPYIELTFNENLNGYVYKEINGNSGLLDFNGSKLYSTKVTDEYNLIDAVYHDDEVATFLKDNKYTTVKLDGMSVIHELTTYSPFYVQNLPFFNYNFGTYVIAKIDNGIMQIKSASGKTIQYTYSSGIISIVAANGNNCIVKNGEQGIAITDDIKIGEYKALEISGNNKLFVVGNSIYNDKAEEVLGGIASGAAIYSVNEYVQAGANVYKYEKGELKLVFSDAKLINTLKEKEQLFAKDGKLISESGKTLADFSENSTYLGEGLILNGTTLYNFKKDKEYKNINKELVEIFKDEHIFVSENGELLDKDGIFYPVSAVAEFGDIVADNPDLHKNKYGYVVGGKIGYYYSASDSGLKKSDYPGGIAVLGEKDNVGIIVGLKNDRIEVYELAKNKLNLKDTYYYSGARAEVKLNYKNGVIVKANNQTYGYINSKGKLIIKPQYSKIVEYDKFLAVSQLEEVSAICDYNGNVQTEFKYLIRAEHVYGEFALVVSTDLKSSIINTNGQEVLKNALDSKKISHLQYENGVWKESEETAYAIVADTEGFKVIKYPVEKSFYDRL